VKNYSSGMFVRLGFAVAAHVEPDVLLIDEVLSVGDESFQRRCAEKIDEFRRDGRTIVFVSHGLGQVEQLCQDVAWIEKGELRMLGPAADVISAYQGDSHQAERVEGEQGSRWGSGEAQIVGVKLRDADGTTVRCSPPTSRRRSKSTSPRTPRCRTPSSSCASTVSPGARSGRPAPDATVARSG
jgi:ABC-type multidrug transport system ATPase subunit